MNSRRNSPKARMDVLTKAFAALQDPVWVAKATIQTRSSVAARLFWLYKRTPPRVSGVFRFPYGQVRYLDALSLLTVYSEIFVRRLYEVAGLGATPYIIDCGGNIGLSVVWFKQQYSRATITVFEADPTIADVLEENMHTLGLQSVEVVRAAVGGVSGPVTFVADGTLSGRVSSEPGLIIESVRLSNRIHRSVDLLKVDIEGGEFDLFKDMCATGQINLVRNIVCEIHGSGEVQEQVAELWAALSDAGFRLTVGATETVAELPGATEPTPFPQAHSGKFVLYLYAWRL